MELVELGLGQKIPFSEVCVSVCVCRGDPNADLARSSEIKV